MSLKLFILYIKHPKDERGKENALNQPQTLPPKQEIPTVIQGNYEGEIRENCLTKNKQRRNGATGPISPWATGRCCHDKPKVH